MPVPITRFSFSQRNLPGQPCEQASNIRPGYLPFLAGPRNSGHSQRSHWPWSRNQKQILPFSEQCSQAAYGLLTFGEFSFMTILRSSLALQFGRGIGLLLAV